MNYTILWVSFTVLSVNYTGAPFASSDTLSITCSYFLSPEAILSAELLATAGPFILGWLLAAPVTGAYSPQV